MLYKLKKYGIFWEFQYFHTFNHHFSITFIIIKFEDNTDSFDSPSFSLSSSVPVSQHP